MMGKRKRLHKRDVIAGRKPMMAKTSLLPKTRQIVCAKCGANRGTLVRQPDGSYVCEDSERCGVWSLRKKKRRD